MFRKLALFAFMMLFLCAGIPAQNSNSVTVTVVAPSTWTITVLPGNYAQNKAATMTITVTAGPVTNACTATWDTLSLPLSFPTNLTNPVALTASVTAAMTATVGPHAVFITCPQPVLTMNSPVMLPNAKVGVPYSAALAPLTFLTGGVPPYTWTIVSGSIPTGLSFSSSGVVSGTPSGAGFFSATFAVKDSTSLTFSPPRVTTGIIPQSVSAGI